MEVAILRKYRENEDPELGSVDGKKIETLTKEELIKATKKRGVDPMVLCELGAIDPRQENLCVILHYAEEVKVAAVPSGASDTVEEGPQRKKFKTGTTDVANLAEKLDVLSKKLEDKKKADEVGELERVRREAKEEAAKGDWANMDILNQKLVLMESLATKLNHSSQKEMTMILARFHANKFCPGLAPQLILKFLSTKEEKGILDEEQKTVKQYGYAHPTAMQMMRPYRYGHYDMQQMYPPQQQAPPFHPWARAVTPPPRMRYHAPRAASLCFKCQKPGHQIRNCPN